MKSFWLAEAEVAGAGWKGRPRYKTGQRLGHQSLPGLERAPSCAQFAPDGGQRKVLKDAC